MNKRKVIIFLIALVVIIALLLILLPKKDDYPFDKTLSIKVDGIDRYFIVHTPENYIQSNNYPLVFVFHGGGANAQSVRSSSNMNQKADSEGFFVVYPQGTDKDMSGAIGVSGTWNDENMAGGSAFLNNINDLNFIDLIVETMENNYSIDKKRIYATGISMGAMMSYQLACKRSKTFAAVAPIAGALTVQNCFPTKSVSIINFHGTLDKFVPYTGGDSDPTLPKALVVGGNYPSNQESIDFFVKANNANPISEIFLESGDTQCDIYKGNNSEGDIINCVSNGAGHTWPGAKVGIAGSFLETYLGTTTKDINATDLMWEFFKTHTLN